MTRISDEQIDAWIEDAKKATQGEWILLDNGRYMQEIQAPERMVLADPDMRTADAIHVRNSQPQNFIAVLEELKEWRAAGEHYKKWTDKEYGTRKLDTI